jgi:hypothetical protein
LRVATTCVARSVHGGSVLRANLAALLPFGAVDVVAGLSSFPAVNAARIPLRRREPKRERPPWFTPRR